MYSRVKNIVVHSETIKPLRKSSKLKPFSLLVRFLREETPGKTVDKFETAKLPAGVSKLFRKFLENYQLLSRGIYTRCA